MKVINLLIIQGKKKDNKPNDDIGKAKYDINNQKEKKPVKSIAEDIEKLKNRREDRKKFDEAKKMKNEQNEQSGKNCDIDFEVLIKKKSNSIAQNPENLKKKIRIKHSTSDLSKIFVCVRKRPISKKELANGNN